MRTFVFLCKLDGTSNQTRPKTLSKVPWSFSGLGFILVVAVRLIPRSKANSGEPERAKAWEQAGGEPQPQINLSINDSIAFGFRRGIAGMAGVEWPGRWIQSNKTIHAYITPSPTRPTRAVHAPPVQQQQQRYLHANGLPARALSRLDVSPFLTPTNARPWLVTVDSKRIFYAWCTKRSLFAKPFHR